MAKAKKATANPLKAVILDVLESAEARETLRLEDDCLKYRVESKVYGQKMEFVEKEVKFK